MHKTLAHVTAIGYSNDNNGGYMYNAIKELTVIVTLAALIGAPIGLWYVGAI